MSRYLSTQRGHLRKLIELWKNPLTGDVVLKSAFKEILDHNHLTLIDATTNREYTQHFEPVALTKTQRAQAVTIRNLLVEYFGMVNPNPDILNRVTVVTAALMQTGCRFQRYGVPVDFTKVHQKSTEEMQFLVGKQSKTPDPDFTPPSKRIKIEPDALTAFVEPDEYMDPKAEDSDGVDAVSSDRDQPENTLALRDTLTALTPSSSQNGEAGFSRADVATMVHFLLERSLNPQLLPDVAELYIAHIQREVERQTLTEASGELLIDEVQKYLDYR